MLRFFRILSLLEGISFLVILSVTLGFISRDYVYFLGMTHGVLFMAYLIMLMVVTHRRAWSIVIWILMFIAAFVPFAFLLAEMFLRKEMGRDQEVTATY